MSSPRGPKPHRPGLAATATKIRRPPTPATAALTVLAILAAARMVLPAAVSGAGEPSVEIAIVGTVLDGDTFDLTDGRRVRMLGIDAPEAASRDHPAEPCAEDSTQWLRSRIESRSVNLQITGVDRYGRSLAWVQEADGTLVNLLSLSAGMSRLLDGFGLPADLEPSLRQATSEAQILRRGIWKKRGPGERKNRT
ncbi:MAG: thermonuclease family protein [Planctomycetaceae bacterium]